MARFGLEFIVMFVAATAIIGNFLIRNQAQILTTNDNSVVFLFLAKRPSLNLPLFTESSTTTILARSDVSVSDTETLGQSKIVLTSTDNTAKEQPPSPTTIQENSIIKTNPAEIDNFSHRGVTNYEVKSGDSVNSIAAAFDISPATVMLANKLDQNSVLKPGQELVILPTTGLSYTITSQDTLGSVTKRFKISEEDFLDANDVESFEDLNPGDVVVIPQENVALPTKPKPAPKFVRDESNKIAYKQAAAPADLNFGEISFVWPTAVHTITQTFWSRHPGIDISDSQTEPIFAAADGFVEISGYEADGYGNTIVINHGNGFKTRYGHASELSVSAGDHVTRGQVIAKQGRTGRVRGATGIHLHFEIVKNGTRVNPLAYVQP